MPWYKISFPRSEASVKIADLVQDFLDTLQTSETRDGIALFREKNSDSSDDIVYYVSLNAPHSSRRLVDVYHAVKCDPPDPLKVDHFGGDASILDPEQS